MGVEDRGAKGRKMLGAVGRFGACVNGTPARRETRWGGRKRGVASSLWQRQPKRQTRGVKRVAQRRETPGSKGWAARPPRRPRPRSHP